MVLSVRKGAHHWADRSVLSELEGTCAFPVFLSTPIVGTSLHRCFEEESKEGCGLGHNTMLIRTDQLLICGSPGYEVQQCLVWYVVRLS